MAASRENIVQKIAAERLGQLHAFECPLTVLASPAWRGIEADIWLARGENGTEIYKHFHPDVGVYINFPAVAEATAIAGDLGIGPKVHHVWPDMDLFALEYLEGWRASGLHDVVNPTIREGVIEAKKAFQAGPRLSRDSNISEEIERFYELCLKAGVVFPHKMTAYLDYAAQAKKALAAAGSDSVPSHRDGNTSNLMIDAQDRVLLLDFDLAANADPFEDLGCYLIEFFECEAEARGGFEEWYGRFDEGLYQRARVYGALDDLRWGLLGLLMAQTSPRHALEFSKYAEWRLMRYGENTQRSVAADGLRCLK